MKKFLFLLLTAMTAATYSFGQKIVRNEVDGKSRFVATDLQACGDSTTTGFFNYGVSCLANGNRYIYELVARINSDRGVKLSQNDDVLIRTFKDNVILASLSINSEASPVDDKIPPISEVYAFISFSSHDQIKQVVTEGIKKIRIASNTGYLQREYRYDTTSKPLSACLDLVDTAVERKTSIPIAQGF